LSFSDEYCYTKKITLKIYYILENVNNNVSTDVYKFVKSVKVLSGYVYAGGHVSNVSYSSQ